MKKTVLVVDDERDIVDLIRYNLQKEGYDVAAAYDGKEALAKAFVSPPDLVILDVMMPVMDGFDVCRTLRANPGTAGVPVMFLTARAGEVDEVVGLELGADDYILKPISPRKLVTRVKTLLRRAPRQQAGPQDDKIVRAGKIEIHRSNYTVKVGKKDVFFPKKEFELLALLGANRGKVFSREMLLNSIWGSDVVVVDRTVDVHIRKIREKLGDEAALIETVKGVGYRFRE